MDDPFLNYFALGILLFVVVILFYGIIAIHDIPHLIAKSRDHPHQDAIHAAGWVSLFTLHVLWPFLWIWAMAYRPDRGWGFAKGSAPEVLEAEIADLRETHGATGGAAEAAHEYTRGGRNYARRFKIHRSRGPLMELLLVLIYVAFCYAIFKISVSRQSMVAIDGRAWRHFRNFPASSGHELQSSVHRPGTDLLHGHADPRRRERTCHRGPGRGEHAVERGGRALPR